MTPNEQLGVERELGDLTLADVPYSFDFAGADKVLVAFKESNKDDKKPENILIIDNKKVEEIISILKTIPRNGNQFIDMAPVIETNVIAFNGVNAFAHVKFYDTLLQGEDTSFGLNSSMEKKLYIIVTQG